MKVPEIKFYNEKTRKFYRLVKTSTWPTVKVSGIFMHRVKDVDPKTDSILKVKALGRIKGISLDTCGGLGYTSILSGRKRKVKKNHHYRERQEHDQDSETQSLLERTFHEPKDRVDDQ